MQNSFVLTGEELVVIEFQPLAADLRVTAGVPYGGPPRHYDVKFPLADGSNRNSTPCLFWAFTLEYYAWATESGAIAKYCYTGGKLHFIRDMVNEYQDLVKAILKDEVLFWNAKNAQINPDKVAKKIHDKVMQSKHKWSILGHAIECFDGKSVTMIPEYRKLPLSELTRKLCAQVVERLTAPVEEPAEPLSDFTDFSDFGCGSEGILDLDGMSASPVADASGKTGPEKDDDTGVAFLFPDRNEQLDDVDDNGKSTAFAQTDIDALREVAKEIFDPIMRRKIEEQHHPVVTERADPTYSEKELAIGIMKDLTDAFTYHSAVRLVASFKKKLGERPTEEDDLKVWETKRSSQKTLNGYRYAVDLEGAFFEHCLYDFRCKRKIQKDMCQSVNDFRFKTIAPLVPGDVVKVLKKYAQHHTHKMGLENYCCDTFAFIFTFGPSPAQWIHIDMQYPLYNCFMAVNDYIPPTVVYQSNYPKNIRSVADYCDFLLAMGWKSEHLEELAIILVSPDDLNSQQARNHIFKYGSGNLTGDPLPPPPSLCKGDRKGAMRRGDVAGFGGHLLHSGPGTSLDWLFDYYHRFAPSDVPLASLSRQSMETFFSKKRLGLFWSACPVALEGQTGYDDDNQYHVCTMHFEMLGMLYDYLSPELRWNFILMAISNYVENAQEHVRGENNIFLTIWADLQMRTETVQKKLQSKERTMDQSTELKKVEALKDELLANFANAWMGNSQTGVRPVVCNEGGLDDKYHPMPIEECYGAELNNL